MHGSDGAMTPVQYAYAALGAVLTTVLVLAALEVMRRKTGMDPVTSIANAIAPNASPVPVLSAA